MPHDWTALVGVVFMLGLRHGLDADHLAAIDGLTRFNRAANPRRARLCGTLFSLGHGAVVVGIAVIVGSVVGRWEAPAWLEDLGAWISIFFLLLLGALNLRTVWRSPPHEIVRPVGIKGGLLGRWQRASHPVLIAGVGALFALSFDTVSQAALFAAAATQFGGPAHAAWLGLTFMLGMLVADGLNGLWIARLISKADRRARFASRVMGLAVGGASLGVAFFGIARYAVPAIDGWSDGKELVFGLGLIAIIALSFVTAMHLSRAPRLAGAPD